MKILYFNAETSGLSGDMMLAALLNLIDDPQQVIDDLIDLKSFLGGIKKLDISLDKVIRNGIRVHKLNIKLKETRNHRTAKILKKSLQNYLEQKPFSMQAIKYANNVLDSLILAEAEVHDELIEKIHLHELSSVDTLIDILGVTTILDRLGVFNGSIKIYCSEIPLGGGSINSAHGILPVPAPATVKILEKSNLITKFGPIKTELSTPTGIALMASMNPIHDEPLVSISKTTYSTGEKEFDNFPNVLRIFFGDQKFHQNGFKQNELMKYNENVNVLETNVDDITGEILGNFIERMDTEDVLDIQILTGITKKNRPSYLVRVLSKPEVRFKLISIMIEELGTLGVRYYTMDRICVDREIKQKTIKIENKSYTIHYKLSYFTSESKRHIIRMKPENDDLRELSKKTGYPIQKLYFIISSQLLEELKENNNNDLLYLNK